jgi:putative transposase
MAWIRGALLTLIGLDIALIALNVALYPTFLAQPNALAYLLEPLVSLAVYAVLAFLTTRWSGPQGDVAWHVGILFGLLTGCLWLINLTLETFMSLSGVASILATAPFLLGGFLLWGVAGMVAAWRASSFRSGVLAAIWSAMMCALLTVACGWTLPLIALSHLRQQLVNDPDGKGLEPAASRRDSSRAVRRFQALARSPLISDCAPIRRNSGVWNSKPYASRTSTNSSRPPNRSENLGVCWGGVAGSTTPRWSNVSSQWQRARVSISRFQQETELKNIRAEMREYASIHSHVLQDVLARLDKTYQAFFRRVKAGEKAGFPRYQGRDRWHSFTYKEFGNGATLDNSFLVLSRIGRIAVRWSRPIEGTPKTVTISREADGWYVCFSCADVPVQPLPATGQETGIDLGIEAFATLSDGTRIFHPGWYRKAERALKTAQRRVSRRKKGSNRRRKAVTLLAKAHQRVRRQRADFHHTVALQLVRQNDTIYHEDLQTANLLRNHHLAKSISDAGWSAFLRILTYKAACAGREVIAVHPAFTSQLCSGCGIMVAKGLSVRWHSCPDCGTSLHRDHNAAKNRERLGQSLRGGVALAASENRASVGR